MRKKIVIIVLIIGCWARLLTAQTPPAPDFSLQDDHGKTVTLSSLRGKYVMLLFWTTRCGYCLMEMQKIRQRCSDFEKNKLAIYAVNVGESKYRVLMFLAKNNSCFTTLFDEDLSTAFEYGLQGVPGVFIVDPAGKIVFHGYRLPQNISQYIQPIP